MKLFRVAKGTMYINVLDPKQTRNFTEEVILDRNEIIMDPNIRSNADTYEWCKEMEYEGYTNETINTILNHSHTHTTIDRDHVLIMVETNQISIM